MLWTLPHFVVGANLPWLSYGGDFGANAWRPDGGVARHEPRARLREVLSTLATSGASLVRWFLLCDGRAGLIATEDGRLRGLDAFVLPDAEAAVEELERAGLRAILVLFDYHWFRPARLVNGVQTGGRAAWLADPRERAQTFDRAVEPILDRLGRTPTIAAWEIINEPEWVTRRDRLAPLFRPIVAHGSSPAGIARADMRAFIGDTCRLIHQRATQPVTVGSASAHSLPLVRGLDLDLYQVHWYDRHEWRAPLERLVAQLGLDRPVLLGEFPTRASARTPAEILDVANRAGYVGALGWSALSGDEQSDQGELMRSLGTFAAQP